MAVGSVNSFATEVNRGVEKTGNNLKYGTLGAVTLGTAAYLNKDTVVVKGAIRGAKATKNFAQKIWSGITGFFKGDKAKEAVDKVADKVKNGIANPKETVKKAGEKVIQTAANVSEKVKNTGIFGSIRGFFGKTITSIKTDGFAKTIGKGIGKLGNYVKKLPKQKGIVGIATAALLFLTGVAINKRAYNDGKIDQKYDDRKALNQVFDVIK